ncbi:MAG: hypothetical protein AAF899_09545 [Pseudomonadota bacterium]
MTDPKVFEMAMLMSFSAGWYVSIFQMLRTGRASGKSIHFIATATVGYLLGCMAKLTAWRVGGPLDWTFYVYSWNGLVCIADLLLVLYLTRRTRPLPA